MKSLLVVGCLCLVAAMVRAESEEMNRFMEIAKEHVESCSKELGVSDADWAKLENDDPKTSGCMHACIMKGLGMMEPTEEVRFNLDKINEIVDKVASGADAAAAQKKMAMDCVEEVNSKDGECEAAMAFSKCYNVKIKAE